MKKQLETLFNQVGKEEMKNLLTTVDETLAKGFYPNQKTFSTVDMWNIQRRKRTHVIR